ncbi:MAG: tripartite tricarboxylate transporter substrate binding protein [Thermodesulfobacteriota bacterium]
MARTLESIISSEKLMSQAIAVVNRPGGSSSIGMAYVAQKKGDPHYWLQVTQGGFIGTPIMGQSKYNYRDFTPLAILAYDYFFLIVKADSPYKGMKDIIEAAKKKPEEIKFGGTGAQGLDAMCAFLIKKGTGAQFNYIPFKGSGDVVMALLGGHIDIAPANPAEAISLVEAKKVRILGVTGEKRLESYPDIPTLKEQGVDVVLQQWRGIAAPKDIPEEAAKFYQDLFKKVSETKAWKKYVRENMLQGVYLNGAETYKVWVSENKSLATIYKEMGIIK